MRPSIPLGKFCSVASSVRAVACVDADHLERLAEHAEGALLGIEGRNGLEAAVIDDLQHAALNVEHGLGRVKLVVVLEVLVVGDGEEGAAERVEVDDGRGAVVDGGEGGGALSREQAGVATYYFGRPAARVRTEYQFCSA